MRIILTIITLLLITVNTTAQVDYKKTKEKDSPEDHKKYGVGLMLSFRWPYSFSGFAYEIKSSDAFYDVSSTWLSPPSIEFIFQPSRTFTHLLGLRDRIYRKFTPYESTYENYDFTNLTNYYQLNFSPFRTKHRPYIGMKILYSYKYYAYNYGVNEYKRHTSQLALIQAPVGYSFTIRKRIKINFELNLNLLAYSSTKYEINDRRTEYWPPEDYYFKMTGSTSTIWTPTYLEREHYLVYDLLLKIHYRFNLKNRGSK